MPKKGGKDASDIVLREHWINSRLALVVEAPTENVAALVAEGYRRPAYPLTMGSSDALLQALTVRIENVTLVPTRQLIHTMVYEDISPLYESFEKLKDIPLTRIAHVGQILSPVSLIGGVPSLVGTAGGFQQLLGTVLQLLLLPFAAAGIPFSASARTPNATARLTATLGYSFFLPPHPLNSCPPPPLLLPVGSRNWQLPPAHDTTCPALANSPTLATRSAGAG